MELPEDCSTAMQAGVLIAMARPRQMKCSWNAFVFTLKKTLFWRLVGIVLEMGLCYIAIRLVTLLPYKTMLDFAASRCPCLKCTIKIIQTGVKEVAYNLSYKVDNASARLCSEAGVQLRRYDPKKQTNTDTIGGIHLSIQ